MITIIYPLPRTAPTADNAHTLHYSRLIGGVMSGSRFRELFPVAATEPAESWELLFREEKATRINTFEWIKAIRVNTFEEWWSLLGRDTIFLNNLLKWLLPAYDGGACFGRDRNDNSFAAEQPFLLGFPGAFSLAKGSLSAVCTVYIPTHPGNFRREKFYNPKIALPPLPGGSSGLFHSSHVPLSNFP